MRVDRRSFICGGGASVFSAMSRCPANAQSDEISVPCVEWLAIRIVAVSSQPSIQNGTGLAVFQPSATPSTGLQRAATIHIQSVCGSNMRSFLIDPCLDPLVLLEHMDDLRIDLRSIDALVLSADSQREYEALRDFLNATNGRLKKNVEVIVRAPWPAKTTSPFQAGFGERASVIEVGQSRIVAEQSFVVGSQQSAPNHFNSDGISLIECPSEPQGMANPTQISSCFVLVEKGLVVIASGNEDAADCVRAAQAASEVRDVHAIVGMNIAAGRDRAKVKSVLSELLEFNPAHIIVSDDIGGASWNIDEGKSFKKVISCSTSTRIVFRT